MKKLLLALLISANLFSMAKAEDVWISPRAETFLDREMPLDVFAGSGVYIGAYELLGFTKIPAMWREWAALTIVGFGAWYKEREVDWEQYGIQASFTDMGWTMAGATVTKWLYGKAKKKAHASLNFNGRQLVYSYHF